MAFVKLIGSEAIFWKIVFTYYKESFLFFLLKILIAILIKIWYPVSSAWKHLYSNIEMQHGVNLVQQTWKQDFEISPMLLFMCHWVSCSTHLCLFPYQQMCMKCPLYCCVMRMKKNCKVASPKVWDITEMGIVGFLLLLFYLYYSM